MTDSDKIESLAADMMSMLGRPVANIREAAEQTGFHANTIRRAVWRGELQATRPSKNGRMTFRVRELARWIVAGERHSLPAPVDADVEAV